jgi:hypothetical protein
METLTNKPQRGVLTYKNTLYKNTVTTTETMEFFVKDGLVWSCHFGTKYNGYHCLCTLKDVRKFEVA